MLLKICIPYCFKGLVWISKINFDENVYGKLLRVELVKKLRNEEKYNDLETLKNAINNDALAAKNYFEINDHVW